MISYIRGEEGESKLDKVAPWNLFLGLSLALRSHDQFQASHWSIRLAGSTRKQLIGRINEVAAYWKDQPVSSRLAGSTR